jgi:hypothetical protein
MLLLRVFLVMLLMLLMLLMFRRPLRLRTCLGVLRRLYRTWPLLVRHWLLSRRRVLHFVLGP